MWIEVQRRHNVNTFNFTFIFYILQIHSSPFFWTLLNTYLNAQTLICNFFALMPPFKLLIIGYILEIFHLPTFHSPILNTIYGYKKPQAVNNWSEKTTKRSVLAQNITADSSLC